MSGLTACISSHAKIFFGRACSNQFFFRRQQPENARAIPWFDSHTMGGNVVVVGFAFASSSSQWSRYKHYSITDSSFFSSVLDKKEARRGEDE